MLMGAIITLIPDICLQVSPWWCSSVSLVFVKTWAQGKSASRYCGQYLARETSDDPPALNLSHCQSTSTTPISPGTEHRPRVRVQKKNTYLLVSAKYKSTELDNLRYSVPCESEGETKQ